MLRKLLNFNWILFLSMVALIVMGTFTIMSAGQARSAIFHGMWKANLETAALGLGIYFALAHFDYRKYLTFSALPAYVFAVAMLFTVLVAGSTVYGSRRWLWFFQPSEVSKLCVIMFLAETFGNAESWLKERFGIGGFFYAGCLVGLPALLILLEPDLGTTLALIPAVTVMLLVAGVWRKGLLAMIATAALAAMAVLAAVGEAERPGTDPERREKIMRFVPLRPHQVKRVKTFLYPDLDPYGAGYNQLQARMAIGSGGEAGKGFGKAETNRLRYLPPSVSMNDFIFCVYAEEQGYRGVLFMLALYAALCLSCTYVAFVAADERGRIFALGFATLVFAHVFINLGMSIGLLPITGLPLPFISSGRTFLLTVMAGLGIIQSISIHREEIR